MHDQMRVIVEYYCRDQVIAAQIADEIDCGMAGHLPLVPSHRATDVQSEKNSVVLDLHLHGLVGRHFGYVVHQVNVGIVDWVGWSLQHACICPDPMKHLPDVCMGDIVVLTMYASS